MYTVAPEDSRSQSLLPLHLITAGTQHIQETRVRPQGPSTYQILLVEQGQGLFEWPGHSRLISAGSAVLLYKGSPVNYWQKGSSFITSWVSFDGPGASNLLAYFHAYPQQTAAAASLSPMILACCRLIQKGASPEILSALLYQMIVTFFETARQENAEPTLEKAKAYAREHLHQDLSVAELARAAGISSSLLHRLFQQEHSTPLRFLRQERIRRAKELLLQSPEQKIAEIAQACGFSDCAYFCKVFREETGESPLHYRKNFV